MELTIQIYGEKGWCDAARLRLNEEEALGPARL